MLNLLEIRKEKLRAEIETAKRIKEKGINPIDVLDELVAELFKLMEIGIIEKHPNLNEKELLSLVRQQIQLNEKYKKKKF
jgi:lipoate-protein ligase A